MGNRCRLAIVTAIATISLASASGASAATQVGNDCPAATFTGAENSTLVPISKDAGSPMPMTVPAAGIVTRWKVNSAVGPIKQKLKVFRSTGAPEQFQAVAESSDVTVAPGPNAFDVRIPVQAGDRFGLYAATPAGGLYCTGKISTDALGHVVGDVPVGSTQTFAEEGGLLVAVSAVVESDVDGDGFGDETQDGCPQSAAFQSACPTVSLDLRASAGKKAATLLVTADSRAPVSVSGAVKLPKAMAKASKKAAARVKLSGGTQIVEPGKIARFKLAFPKRLRKALESLPPKRSLKLWITAAVTNLSGQVTTPVVSVKLKGQGG